MKTFRILAIFSCASAGLAGLSGCATDPAGAPVTSSATFVSVSKESYAWRDPEFYDPWYDPKSVALPPPAPFNGFGSDGKAIPLLPTRTRPATGP